MHGYSVLSSLEFQVLVLTLLAIDAALPTFSSMATGIDPSGCTTCFLGAQFLIVFADVGRTENHVSGLTCPY